MASSNFTPSLGLILQWILNGELWRLGVGEDPHWGTRPVDQIVLKAAIHELAGKITDEKVRAQVQSTVAGAMVNVAQKMAGQPR